MSFKLIPSKTFLKQIKGLDKQSKRIIEDKINLIKANPYRYKKIHSELFSRVFRVRLSIKKRETRLIYVVIEPNIILVCLLERKNEYKIFENTSKKFDLIKIIQQKKNKTN